MRILNSLACILSIFLLQACASKVYLEGQVRPDISYHISYGKSYQINYSVGKFREIDDEGQKILWPDYIPHKNNPEINPEETVVLGFDGYINNYHSRKVSFFLSYQITKGKENISDEIWLFDTSQPTRKFLIKCPLIPGTDIQCFLILKNERMFDLNLPEVKYRVSGEFDENTNKEQIKKLIKEVNNLE